MSKPEFTREEILEAAHDYFGIDPKEFEPKEDVPPSHTNFDGASGDGKSAEKANSAESHREAAAYHRDAAEKSAKIGEGAPDGDSRMAGDAAKAHTAAAAEHEAAAAKHTSGTQDAASLKNVDALANKKSAEAHGASKSADEDAWKKEAEAFIAANPDGPPSNEPEGEEKPADEKAETKPDGDEPDVTVSVTTKKPSAEKFREVSDEERKKLAKEGHALPGGGFPIKTVADLNNAKQAVGRAKNPEAARRHINDEADRLGEPRLGESDSEKFYSEDQERGENGRWISGGGGMSDHVASAKMNLAEHAGTYQEHQNAAKHHDEAVKTAPDKGIANMHRAAAEDHRAAALRGRSDPGMTKIARESSKNAHDYEKAYRDKIAASPSGNQGTAKVAARIAAKGKMGAAEGMTFDALGEVNDGDGKGPERNAVRLAFAAALDPAEVDTKTVDGVEYVVGRPIHIFPAGEWTAVDGRHVEFTAQDAAAMMADLRTRHSDVALTFDHETDKARGSEAAGWMPIGQFRLQDDGLWNMGPLWRKDVYATLIATGAFRYLSGDALGVGSAHPGDAFHPRRLLAASLVPKPGFVRGLKGIQLAADEKAAIEAWLAPPERKEFSSMAKMTRAELCQKMGISEDATAEEFKTALVKWAEEESAEPEHAESSKEKMGAKEGLCAACKNGEECDDPNCDCPECEDNEGGEKMGAKENTPGTGDEKLVAEQFAALGKQIADKAVESATAAANEAVEKTVTARFAAQAREKEIADLLAEAQKDGRLKTADVDLFRETFAMNFDHASKLLAALPKPAVAPSDSLTAKNAFITGNGSQVMTRDDLKVIFDNPDRDSRKYAAQSKFLTAVARFSATTGVDPASAMASVLRGENEKLEREIFAAEGKTAEDFTGEHVGQFRASQRQLPVDPELVEFLKKRVGSGKLPNSIVRDEVQQFASITDFQPSAKTTLPMALGYFQSEFVGDEALPVFVGGADEKAAWPELFFEKFAAIAQPTGLLGAPTETSLNVTWHTVTLEKYPVRGNIDRRARAASITLPRGIDTIMLENLKSQVGVTKETAQAAFLTTNGNYYDATYYPSVTAWSSAGTPAAYVSLPIEDIYKGMQHVRVGVRAWPDLLLLSPAAAAALRKNQQIIDTVRYTGTQERPGTGVSNQTIAALFAGLFNLTIVVGEAGTASLPSGAPVSDVWGLDAWLLCTGKGQIEAPRFGMTVGAAGSPRVRSFAAEHLGADGADAIVYTDAWSIVSIAKKAGYRMVGASAAI